MFIVDTHYVFLNGSTLGSLCIQGWYSTGIQPDWLKQLFMAGIPSSVCSRQASTLVNACIPLAIGYFYYYSGCIYFNVFYRILYKSLITIINKTVTIAKKSGDTIPVLHIVKRESWKAGRSNQKYCYVQAK